MPKFMGSLYQADKYPFDTFSGPKKRSRIQVLLCILFNEMYQLGWKAAGDGSMDMWKKRGSIVFKSVVS